MACGDSARVMHVRTLGVLAHRPTVAVTKPHIEITAERGRMGWQKATGCNWRALIEADIARWKRVIGDGLRSQWAREGNTTGRTHAQPALCGTPGGRFMAYRPPRVTMGETVLLATA